MTIFKIMIAFIIGIIWGLFINNIASIFLFVFIPIVLLLLKRKQIISKKDIVIIVITFFISFTNILVQEYSFNNKYKDLINKKELYIEAIVVSNVKEKEYQNQYKIKIEKINSNNKFKGTYLLLSLKNKKEKLEYGDRICFTGEFNLAQPSKNYGGFDYRQYLKTDNIYGITTTKKIEKRETDRYNNFLVVINSIRTRIESNSKEMLNNNEANLLNGILIGDKSNLDKDLQQSFRDSNLSHILAVSGAHVSYVILGLSFLLSKVKVGKNISKITTIILLIFFMLLTNATPSVVRACIMAIYIIVGSLLHKKTSAVSAISLSVIIILIINPYKILDIGMQLSYGGTIGIILFSKRITDYFNSDSIKKGLLKRLFNSIKAITIVSISANIIIIPIIAYYYNTISLTFIISNILASPLLGIIIILGFITILISFISIKIAGLFSFILSFFLKLIIFVTNICSNLPFSKIYVKTPTLIMILIYYAIIILILKKRDLIKKSIKKALSKTNITNIKKIVAFIIALVLIVQLIKIIPQELKIYFIDVGQGDSSLIVTPNHKTILIDGGGTLDKDNYDVGKNVLIPYLLDRGIITLDYIIISHFDSDHVGGLLTLMNELKVRQVIISKQGEDSSNYQEFRTIVKNKKIQVRVVNMGDVLNIEKDVCFEIIWPNNSKLISENVLNNNSIVCKLHYRDFSMLFTGDIEEIAEKEILKEHNNNLSILKSVVLKVAHHGSKTSSSKELIEAVKPSIALIGVGENNKFGHPNDEVIKRLTQANAYIYRTDKMGEIMIRVNKKGKYRIQYINKRID